MAVSRRSAQRATAARVRAYRQTGEYKPVAVSSATRARISATQEAYGRSVLDGSEPRPAKGTPEGNQLARLASLSKHGKADPRFFAAFQEYFYHVAEQR